MKKRESFRQAGRILVLCGLALTASVTLPMMEGCKKKEVPKPTPPPPPPPVAKEPDPIDLKALAQTLKASKKVAFADGASTNKEALAKAIIDLADSIARGDDKKFAGLIGAEDKSLLKTLTSSGEWKDGTAKIESVRVLNIREGGDVVASSGGALSADVPSNSDILKGIKMQMEMSPEVKQQILDRLGHEPTEADMALLIEITRENIAAAPEKLKDLPPEARAAAEAGLAMMEKQLDAIEAAQKNKDKAADPAPASSGDSDTKFTVVFAVQEPGAAFAQAWVAVPLGEKWVFKASSGQLPAARTRATEFDAMFGGSGGDAPSADKPAEKAEEKADDKPKDESPAPSPGQKGKGGGGRTTGG